MKHPILFAALAAFFPSTGLLSAAQEVPTFEDTAFPSADGSSLPGMLTPGALSALGAELLLDEPGDGRTWARGPQWKASFGPEGLTYIPFFGSDAPQNYPVRFDLVGARVGEQRIGLGERKRSRDGQTVTLDRAGLAEVYHLSKDEVEQTFVFDELPLGGDLVLEIEVETELVASHSNAGGILFSGALGQVHYDQAVAVDARGSSLELRQELTPTGLRIVVPENYLRLAAFPLVVDPILSTFSITTDSRRQVDVDVAYEGNNATYQIVYSELQSAVDSDIIAVSYNDSLNLLLPAVSLDITSSSWATPRNASCFHEQQFLCVAIVGNSIGSRVVWGRTRHSGTGVRGPQFQISGFGAEAVDVGGKGNELVSNYDYVVVWQEADTINQDFDIVAQVVRADSTLTLGRIVIDGDVGDMDRAPSISKSSGRPGTSNADNQYMIVWEREISSTDHNIRGQVLDFWGSMTGHAQFNVYTFSDSLDPDVSTVSNGSSYNAEPYWVVAFERLIGAQYDIFTVVALDGSADNARNVNVMQNLDLDRDHRDPIIAFDSQDYLICYQTEGASGDRAVHFTSANVVHDDGELRMGLSLRREMLALSEGAPASLGLASSWDGGGTYAAGEPNAALAAWTFRDGVTTETDVAGAVIVDTVGNVLGAQYCEAAPNSTGASAWMSAYGSYWNVGTSFTLACAEMPLNAFGYFLCSNLAGFVMNPNGSQGHLCLQGAIGRFNQSSQILNSGGAGGFTLSVDSSSLPSPNGNVSVLSGETWNFQCWFRESGGNSNFSNGVSVTFD